MVERRYSGVTVRAVGEMKIGGLASVTYSGEPGSEYELYADVWERIAPGAFDGVLRGQPDTVALFNHDANEILGRTPHTLSLRADAGGLHYEVQLDPDIQRHRELFRLIERGDVRGSSFAARVAYAEWGKEDGREVRTIQRFDLLADVSPVTYPAYSSTSTGIVRSAERAEIEAEKNLFYRMMETRKLVEQGKQFLKR